MYLQYKVAVEVDGKEYPAYGCECNWWHSKIEWRTGGDHPYEYTLCDGDDNLINGKCLDN